VGFINFVIFRVLTTLEIGKHGNLREFVTSGKLRENSGNLKFTQGIYQMLLIVI